MPNPTQDPTVSNERNGLIYSYARYRMVKYTLLNALSFSLFLLKAGTYTQPNHC